MLDQVERNPFGFIRPICQFSAESPVCAFNVQWSRTFYFIYLSGVDPGFYMSDLYQLN